MNEFLLSKFGMISVSTLLFSRAKVAPNCVVLKGKCQRWGQRDRYQPIHVSHKGPTHPQPLPPPIWWDYLQGVPVIRCNWTGKKNANPFKYGNLLYKKDSACVELWTWEKVVSPNWEPFIQRNAIVRIVMPNILFYYCLLRVWVRVYVCIHTQMHPHT